MAGEHTTTCLRLPFGATRRAAAAFALAVTLALVAYGLALSIAARNAEPLPEGHGDALLYLRIIDRLHAGEPYYPVVAEEHRRAGYPLRPFVTVRLPTLAVAMGALPGESTRRAALGVLAIAAFGAWAWRLSQLGLTPLQYGAAVLLVACGVVPATSTLAYTFHETWAGMLIALSLALNSRRVWLPSVAVGLTAALTRELAGAYLVAMLALAVKDRRWGEAAGWVAALALSAAALATHAVTLRDLVVSTDLASPGWAHLNGWPFLMDLACWNLVGNAGLWIVALLLPLSLLGLAMLRCPFGERLALTVIGYAAAFMAVGRTNNAYWGLMIAPLWPLGAVFAWASVKELLRRARAA